MRVLEVKLPGREWRTCPIPIPANLTDEQALQLAELTVKPMWEMLGSDPRFEAKFRIVEGPVN